jgi:hypothetical protein
MASLQSSYVAPSSVWDTGHRQADGLTTVFLCRPVVRFGTRGIGKQMASWTSLLSHPVVGWDTGQWQANGLSCLHGEAQFQSVDSAVLHEYLNSL